MKQKARKRNGVEHTATPYRGSKWQLWDWMEPYMRFPHQGFVDLFGGGGSVTICKSPVKLRVYNDLDGDATNFFRQARDDFEELAWLLTMTPYGREEHDACRIKTGDETPVELARKWFCSAWMNRTSLPFSERGLRRQTQPDNIRVHPQDSFVNAKIAMVQVAQIFQGVLVENKDFRTIIQEYRHPTTLIYADPPYLRSTGRVITDYAHDPKGEAEYALHSDLAELLNEAVGYRIVAGSPCQEYADWYELRGWQRVDKEVRRDSNGKEKRSATYIESMWLCPRVQAALNQNKQLNLFSLMGETSDEEE